MNDLISKNLSPVSRPAVTAGEQLAIEDEPADTPDEAPATEPQPETVPATEVMFDCEPAEQTDAVEGEPEATEPAPKKSRRSPRSKNGSTGKNKVGDMFDMLTFKDV